MQVFFAILAVIVIVALICIGLNLDIIARNSKLITDQLERIADALENKHPQK